jgi:hypothetical protein
MLVSVSLCVTVGDEAVNDTGHCNAQGRGGAVGLLAGLAAPDHGMGAPCDLLAVSARRSLVPMATSQVLTEHIPSRVDLALALLAKLT